tara:strand:- start:16 stop:504 length:489 start_codon:yes stop_codon:yes gene_type:complete
MGVLNNFLDNLKISVNRMFLNKFWMLTVFFLILIFIVVSYYSYNLIVKDKLSEHKLNKEFINRDKNSEDIFIVYFYTEWCPYCKSSRPQWDKFSTYVNNINNTNDYKTKLFLIDCDKEKAIADRFEIEGYPTVKLIYKSEVYDYDAKVTKENLIEFLNSIKK